MKIIEGFEPAKAALSRHTSTELYQSDLEPKVKQIIDEVRRRGDAALFDYTLKIDRAKLSSLEVSKEQIKNAYHEVDEELVSALKLAADQIRSFHTAQKDNFWSGGTKPDSGQLVRPLERIGVYAPGKAYRIHSSKCRPT